MRKVTASNTGMLMLGCVGENNAVQVIWPDLLLEWRDLYGDGTVQLAVKRPMDNSPYPVPVNIRNNDIVWNVQATDVANSGFGLCELTYLVDDAVVKSRVWKTFVMKSLSGNGTTTPPDAPSKAWFDSIQSQIGNLADLSTSAKRNLVEAINEAARSGGGGGMPYELGTTLKVVDGVLDVNTSDAPEQDNTQPITSAAVYSTVGNIEALLSTI